MAWTLRSILKDWVTPALLIVLIAGGYRYVSIQGEKEKRIQIENAAVQFDSAEEKIKTKTHVNTPYNAVNAYKQSIELTKQSIKLDSSYVLIDKIYQQKIKDDSQRKIDKLQVEKSRSARDSINRLILEKLKKLEN